MTDKKPWDYRNEGEFERAGEHYTYRAYDSLSDPLSVENGLDAMRWAALCYRLAGIMHRAENRSRQGVLIAQDIQAHVLDDPREKTLVQECIADFHAIGRLEGMTEAHEEAIKMYENTGIATESGLISNGICDNAIMFTKYLTDRSANFKVEELEGPLFPHTTRVAFKMEHMDSLIESFET